MQIFAIVVSLAFSVVGIALTTRAVRAMLATMRTGQPALNRTDRPAARTLTMFKETFLHTRMLQWTWVGILHWFAYAAFIVLSTAVAQAFFQLFKADFVWPLIGHWIVYEWIGEILGLFGALAIIPLFIYRVIKRPSRLGRQSRFFGSTMWQAYFVEAMVLIESSAIIFIRAAEYKLIDDANPSHFPISRLISGLYPDSDAGLENVIYFIAMIKITSAMLWLMVISTNLTMGVAWHRFTAWFNIWFKRESSGRTALGAMAPMTSGGKAITLDDLDDLDEDSKLGMGSISDFSWKGILDFTTCTECGRCQSQCPAWNTEKPLSPKLLMMALREEAYAVAGTGEAAEEKSIVGKVQDGEWFYNPEGADFIIDEDVLWSCTSCGACVQQCPVDIEHVDHIMDMRRYQVLVESNFPAELNGLFKGLENKGNPWNMSASARMDWAKDLPFEVKVVGGKDANGIADLESVDWLFWVGCAGAYEDRAKKTTRAVAELLDMAGVSFGVLGNGETCTGDPARRAGNEFVFQGLAQQNIETFKEFKVKKVVSTCAHCFNTLKNEYREFGIELEVVHHTQLLNKLVRDGKLTPIKDGEGAAKRSITYHDPCFLGRHNQVYSPPRELLQILPGAEVKEMPRNSEKSFCCGAGGARMWMEENIGERININRTQEAVATGADQIAVGCPFCRVMLSDGLTSEQANGGAREEVEVLDVAQMLLASVKGESATRAPKPATAKKAAAPAAATDVATKAEPEAGDVTQSENTVTATEDVGPAAKASGGSSLFDAPTETADKPAASSGSLFDTPADTPAPKQPESSSGSLFDAPTETADKPAASSGSLFDTPADTTAPKQPESSSGSLFDTPADTPAPKQAESSGGSLFDVAADEPAKPAEKPAAKEAAPAEPGTTDLGAGGSLFDVAADEPAAKAEAPSEAAAESGAAESAPAQIAPEDAPTDLGAGGSLFDIPTEVPAAKSEPAAPKAEKAATSDEAPPVTEAQTAPDEPTGAASVPNTDVDLSSGSLFDISAPEAAPVATAPAQVAPSEPAPVEESTAEVAPAADTAAADASAAASGSKPTSTPATDVDISSMGSLFDISAPEPTETPAAAATAAVEESAPSGAELSQTATEAVPEAANAAEESDSAPVAGEQDKSEAAPVAQEGPAEPKGAENTPKQADINDAGSLFDL